MDVLDRAKAVLAAAPGHYAEAGETLVTPGIVPELVAEIARLRAGADIIRELVACFKPFCPADYKDGTQAIRVAEVFLSANSI